MEYQRKMLGGVVLVFLTSGCALEELRSKNAFGAEWRTINAAGQDDERYTVQPGLEFKWEKGWNTGVSFRTRHTNEGQGTNDNGVFMDFSFPLWKRPKPEAKTADHVRELEYRIQELEAAQAKLASSPPTAGGNESREAHAVGSSGSTGKN
jgi:hypothetical protein